ncbi:MAG: DUF402 domain-containing protein [Anaerolineae bacterium]|nr:DUF402 domain-containing protein [Anaerolineae bacterium]
MTDFIVYKCDHHGSVVWQYPATVVERSPNHICLAATFDREVADMGFVVFRRGDAFTEWFYSDRWYNIFRVEDGQTGDLKGWYCNITRPAIITATDVRADDLALDVYVMPTGSIILLDEDEFAALDLEANERIAALRAVETIREAVIARTVPFNEIHP